MLVKALAPAALSKMGLRHSCILGRTETRENKKTRRGASVPLQRLDRLHSRTQIRRLRPQKPKTNP